MILETFLFSVFIYFRTFAAKMTLRKMCCRPATGRTVTSQCKVIKKCQIMKILIINGPNLNLLGVREPGIYGSSSFDSFLSKLEGLYPDVEFEYYQSNIEGCLIDKMQETGFSYDGIVLNAGAYTHTSVALQDCIRSLSSPVIEVHISNVHKREEFRHKSMISCACAGVICGFGLDSYRLAVEAVLQMRRKVDN